MESRGERERHEAQTIRSDPWGVGGVLMGQNGRTDLEPVPPPQEVLQDDEQEVGVEVTLMYLVHEHLWAAVS